MILNFPDKKYLQAKINKVFNRWNFIPGSELRKEPGIILPVILSEKMRGGNENMAAEVFAHFSRLFIGQSRLRP
jgi:hypothetical protein